MINFWPILFRIGVKDLRTITHTADLDFSVEQIFNLVNDIEAYPKFLSWCRSASIESQSESEIVAVLRVAKAGFEKNLKTRNTLVHNKSIIIHLADDANKTKEIFRHFEGAWSFETLGEQGCKATYTMKFEFKNFFVGKLAESVFKTMANQMIDSFKKRAEALYR